MAWHRYCNCRVWVEATKCPGNDSPERVFVHQDNLPESTKVLKFGGECWVVSPSSDRKCLPKGVHRLHPVEDNYYDDCDACDEPDPEPPDPPPSGPSSPPQQGPVLEPRAGGGGYYQRAASYEGVIKGIKVTVCAAHAARAADHGVDLDNVYLYTRDESTPAVLSTGLHCYQVPSGPVVEPPDDTWYILDANRYDSCEECTNGYLAQLCPNDQLLEGADAAPDLYIRPANMASCPNAFQRGRWCYAKPAGASVVIPPQAIIWKPKEDALTCPDCDMGIPFTPCPDQSTTDKEYWAPASEAQALIEAGCPDTIYQRIDGRCYYLLLTATAQRIPRDAIRIPPRRAFASCEDCLCDLDRDICEGGSAVSVRLCDGQNAAHWREAYMPVDVLPSALTVFSYDGFCCYVDPTDGRVTPPPDALLIRKMPSTYDSCDECFGSGGYNGGGPGWERIAPPWPLPHPHPKTPREGEGLGTHLGGEYAGLRDCETHEIAPYYINITYLREWHGEAAAAGLEAGTVVALNQMGDKKCYEIIRPWSPRGMCVNFGLQAERYDNCEECLAKCTRGNCTFDDDSTITGFGIVSWTMTYSDAVCGTPEPNWEPESYYAISASTLLAQWTNEDLSNCALWEGQGTLSSGHAAPGVGQYSTIWWTVNITLRVLYTSANQWQYQYHEEDWPEGLWTPLYGLVNDEHCTQSDCDGFARYVTPVCQAFLSPPEYSFRYMRSESLTCGNPLP
jgi:hypothetical protein